MQIKSFAFDTVLSRDFLRFRAGLYEENLPEDWALPAQFSPDFEFYRRPNNKHCNFAAFSDGAMVGHISAMINSELKDRDGAPVATLGFFECVNDGVLANQLISQAVHWVGSVHGPKRIWAPMNFDIWHKYRFMTGGFEKTPFYGEPRNMPYYPDFFLDFGFTARLTWESVENTVHDALQSMPQGAEETYKKLKDLGYRFEAADLENFGDRKNLHGIEQQSFRDLLGFTPLPFSDFEGLCELYEQASDKRFLTLVYDLDAKVVGFSVGYPHLPTAPSGEAASENKGNSAVYYMVGLSPTEVKRKIGTGRALHFHTVNKLIKEGYAKIIFAMLAENSRAWKLVTKASDAGQRVYTLYQIDV